MVSFFLAAGAARAGEQSLDDRARIRVHVVALAELRAWAARAEGSGVAVDPVRPMVHNPRMTLCRL